MTDTLPEEFFIFVNQLHPQAAHNYRITRTFTSRFYPLLTTEEGRQALDKGEVDPFPFVPNPSMYPDLSPFVVSAMNEYRIEWDAEQVRQRHFSLKPSRLSAIFAFGDEQSCVEVADKYSWPLGEVRRFKLRDPDSRARCSKVNMEIVSLMRYVYPLAAWGAADIDNIWAHYWSGGGDLPVEVPDLRQGQAWRRFNSGVIWEWLIEGQVVSENAEPVFQ